MIEFFKLQLKRAFFGTHLSQPVILLCFTWHKHWTVMFKV